MKLRLPYGVMLSFFSVILLFSCNKEESNGPDNDDVNIEPSHLIEVTSRVIRDSGLDFPQSRSTSDRESQRPTDFEWPPEDYITVDASNSEQIIIKLWLGPDDHIIPTPDWQAANPNYCMDQGKYMLPARKLLQFKIHNLPRDGIRSVQLNYINVLDYRIEQSVITDWYEADPDWMYQAMSEVWDEMRTRATIKNAVAPCDDRIPLTLYFNSAVTYDITEAMVYEEFEFSILLQFDESEGKYTGIADLVWVDGWVWNKVENNYLPYPTNKSGQMEIVSLITPALAGNSIENATMNFRVPMISPENSSFLLISFGEFYTWVNNQNDTMEFRVDNWQLLDDPDIIMGTYTNNTTQVDGGTLTEITTIEIGH